MSQIVRLIDNYVRCGPNVVVHRAKILSAVKGAGIFGPRLSVYYYEPRASGMVGWSIYAVFTDIVSHVNIRYADVATRDLDHAAVIDIIENAENTNIKSNE